MRKFFLNLALLLSALIVGSVNVWGAEETISLSSQGYSNAQVVTSTSGTNVTLTYVKGTSSTDPAYYNTGNGVRVYYGGNMTVTAGTYTITKVIVTFGKDKSPTISMTSNGTTTSGGTDSPATWIGSATEVYFNVATKGHARIQSVEVTFTVPKKDPTASFIDGNLNVGQNLDLSTLFISNSDGDVTYTITSGDSYASILGSTLTGVAAGSVTVKASQAATDFYNAVEKSATITVNAALTLDYITITTTPTKTTYTEGDTFDPAGMVVTAYYTNTTSSNVTAYCSFTPSTVLSISDEEITISYTENAVTKTTSQAITVNPYIQPTVVSLSLNNAFFGTSYTGANAKGSGSHSGSQDNIEVNFSSGGETNNFYISDTEIRGYDGNTLEFVAPDGFVITKLQFDAAWAAYTTVTPDGLNDARTIWSDSKGATSVSFAPPSKSTVTTVTATLSYPRTTSSTKYGTICLPKSVESAPGVEQFYTVAGFRGTVGNITSVVLEEADLPLTAGKPYIFLANANNQTFNVTGDAVATPVTAGNNGLVGQFAASKITDNDCSYIIRNNEICLVDGNDVNCPAYRAYLNFEGMSEFAGAPGRYIEIPCAPNNATNFNAVGENVEIIKFFQNGQLYILRDGITYDAMGKRVK